MIARHIGHATARPNLHVKRSTYGDDKGKSWAAELAGVAKARKQPISLPCGMRLEPFQSNRSGAGT